MRLFPKNRPPVPPSTEDLPVETKAAHTSPPSESLSPAALELWSNRYFLIAGYTLLVIGLLAWGYVILPGSGWLSWLWWPVTVGALLAGGGLLTLQLKRAKIIVEPANSARFVSRLAGLGQKLPLGLLPVLLAGFFLNSYIVTPYS